MLAATNPHPRDNCIRFDELPHIYYVNSVKVDTSVTSFVHKYFPHFDAKRIAKMCVAKGKRETTKYTNMTYEEILDQWEENRIQSTTAGTLLHKTIEDFYNGVEVSNDTPEFGYFMNFNSTFKNELIPYRTEWEVFHEELDLAGSIDMVYRDNDNNFMIYDWKRSKEIKKNSNEYGYPPLDHLPNCNFWHYSLQLNVYKYILESKYDMNIKEMYLVVLHPDEFNYRRIQVPNLQEEVNSMVNARINHLNNRNSI